MTLNVLNSGRKPGFTLIELMVVLAIIGIMTAMIIPEMRGSYEDALLRSTSRKLVNALSVAYSRTISVRQSHRVRLDRTTHRYLIERRVPLPRGQGSFVPVRDLPGGDGKMDARISIELRQPGNDLSAVLDQGLLPAARDEMSRQDRAETITFYPDGTADACELRLEDRQGFRLALRINPTTARVQIVELERK